ncbi:PAS domain S-box protein [Aurantibacter sp.]|uniref:PAS domain-containing sensor histidine kinase n=1 Tax=Aurantibacter sp. TaxID=2807103 RepID=UPI00326799B9
MTDLVTSSISLFVKSSPKAVVVVDTNMHIIGYSDVWLKDIAKSKTSLIGESYYNILPNTSDEARQMHLHCLQGQQIASKTFKSIDTFGRIKWTKCAINSWNNENGIIAGLSIIEEDITVDRHREEVLLKAQKVARIGGWEVDLRNGQVHWTAVTKEIHEVPLDFQPDLETSINFYKEGTSKDEITRCVSEAIAEGTSWDLELQIVTAKGKELWVRAKGETEMFNGECIRVYGTFQDIDEKKRIEIDYHKVSDRLAMATSAAKIGIWNYDFEDNSLHWDDITFDIYKADKNTFAGYETLRSILHPDDYDKSVKAIKLALTGQKEFNTDFRIIWPDNTIRHIKGRGAIIYDSENKPIKIIGANWDITEFKNTKLELLRNNESFTAIFSNSNVGMTKVNLKGTMVEVNDAFCKMLGYTRKELLNRTAFDITFPDDIKKSQTFKKRLVSGEVSSIQAEKRFYHKNGTIIHSMISITSVNDINGKISHLIGQIVNMTSRIEAEKRLKTLVEVTKGQNASLMNFAHIVSHNLRSHSSNMLMLTRFLNLESDHSEKQNIEKMLGNAAESLNETVHHLNEVVLIKTGALETMKSESLLNAVNRVKDTLTGLIQEKNAVYEFNICKTHFVNVVPAYLDSILLNLFSNSLKYSSPDRKPKISISSEIKDEFIEIKFADNGLGIDLKRHGKKIFGMYKTFHNNKDAKGIGLFITKNQIEAMNGKIELTSELNKGTIFTLKFKKA